MNIQELEELQHGDGMNEQQRVLAWNSLNTHGDEAKINKLIDDGLFVVVNRRTVYCPSTDAIMGSRLYLEASFPTRELAEEGLGKIEEDPEGYLFILPQLNLYTIRLLPQDVCEIPF